MRGRIAGVLVAAACAGCGEEEERGPPDLVLVSIDTLRADRLGALGHGGGLTPNLDAFAAEAVVFDHAYSQAIQTAPAHAATFTSRYPTEVMSQSRQPWLGEGTVPTLAQVLATYGYQTGAFVGGADLSPHMGLTGGFATYESPVDFGSLHHTAPLAMQWLDARDTQAPTFAFIHGYDTHSLYLKPPPFGYLHADAAATGPGQAAVRTATERIIDGALYTDFMFLVDLQSRLPRPRSPAGRAMHARVATKGRAPPEPMTDADIALVRGVYDGAVAYADAQFGLLMAGLQARGLLDSAVVVVMSDHGEGLGEDGLFGHCCAVNDEEAHVVLMVRHPMGKGGGRKVDALVGLIDVMPTLLELAGATLPADIRGVSLVPALRGEPFAGRATVLTQTTDTARIVSVRGAAGRLSYTGLKASSRYLPDLVEAGRLDGPGFSGTAGLAEAQRDDLRDGLVATLRSVTPAVAPEATPLPESLKKELREHGYWEVGP